jgi:hypothetical protein
MKLKLTKTILSAMAVAVAVSAGTACKKSTVDPEKKVARKTPTPDPCPACGMG